MSILQLDKVHSAPWGKPLLENINFELKPGNILGIIGPNGAGKTSLLNTIVGDCPVESGQLLLSSKTLAQWNRRELARHLAFLPQLSLLNFPYTVEEVILLGRSPHDTGAEHDRKILKEVLALADIGHLQGRLYTRLSGGEKQRVQLARIYSQIWQDDSLEGKLLLLDEPTAALDIQHQQGTAAAISTLADRGCAVVLVIHDFNTIASLADQLVVLDNGRQVAHGAPRQVLSEKLFRETFSADLTVMQHPNRDQLLIISNSGVPV